MEAESERFRDTMEIVASHFDITDITKEHPADEAADTVTIQDEVCHLLRIPAEIRLSIYRYLILPETSINLAEFAQRQRDNAIEQTVKDNEGNEGADEDEWEDETDSEGGWSDTGCPCGQCTHDLLDDLDDEMEEPCLCGMCDMNGFDSETDDDSDTYSIITSPPMHMEILRTNRQIYHEASALLYSEAELVLGMDDILCLAGMSRNFPTPLFLNFNMEPPKNTIWRYDPLKGIGKQHKKGGVTYKSAEREGRLDPHVFARFQKLEFEMLFDEDFVPEDFEIWIDDETLEFNQHQATEYKTTIERCTIVKDFVKLISNSRNISSLTIRLEADVIANSTAIIQSNDWEDNHEDSDDDEARAIEKKADKSQETANQRAAELLVDSALFEPLFTLSNVKKFNFDFEDPQFDPEANPGPILPQPKTVERIKAMKTLVEGSWKDPEEASLVGPAKLAKVKSKGKAKEKEKSRSQGKKRKRTRLALLTGLVGV